MITLEQAQALQPGNRVLVGGFHYGQWQHTEWLVIEPEPHQRWDEDKTIVKYIMDAEGYGIVSYVFSTELHRYSLPSGWKYQTGRNG